MTNEAGDDLHGRLSWFKPAQPSAKYYPDGFIFQSEAIGSAYAAAPGAPALNLSGGPLVLSGGDLPGLFTNWLAAGRNNSFTGTNGAKLTISGSSGLFKGSFTSPFNSRKIPFSGAVLQKQGVGRGFFLDAPRSGGVFLGAPPEAASAR